MVTILYQSGILDAVSSGAITRWHYGEQPDLKTQLEWLDSVEGLDLGVHLNLTFRRHDRCLTESWRIGMVFPKCLSMSWMLLTVNQCPEVRIEWRAQIEACQREDLLFLIP